MCNKHAAPEHWYVSRSRGNGAENILGEERVTLYGVHRTDVARVRRSNLLSRRFPFTVEQNHVTLLSADLKKPQEGGGE